MRILRYRQLYREKVPLSRAQIDRREREGTFPKRIAIGPKSCGWDEAEIDAWLEALKAKRDQADGEAA